MINKYNFEKFFSNINLLKKIKDEKIKKIKNSISSSRSNEIDFEKFKFKEKEVILYLEEKDVEEDTIEINDELIDVLVVSIPFTGEKSFFNIWGSEKRDLVPELFIREDVLLYYVILKNNSDEEIMNKVEIYNKNLEENIAFINKDLYSINKEIDSYVNNEMKELVDVNRRKEYLVEKIKENWGKKD